MDENSKNKKTSLGVSIETRSELNSLKHDLKLKNIDDLLKTLVSEFKNQRK